ncbi:MAG TPA: hypothetical protein VGI81_10140 [Tepidisphaeraceae bacterium]|jgi:uncharacterized protein with HEPN domain
MPQHDPKKLLYDMKQAADRIARFADGRTFDDYVADDYFRSAVEQHRPHDLVERDHHAPPNPSR